MPFHVVRTAVAPIGLGALHDSVHAIGVQVEQAIVHEASIAIGVSSCFWIVSHEPPQPAPSQ